MLTIQSAEFLAHESLPVGRPGLDSGTLGSNNWDI
jgi:hypothetical protein